MLRAGIVLAMICALAMALNNVRSYHRVFASRERCAEVAALALAQADASGEQTNNAAVRRRFYTVLQKLESDRSLNRGETGIFVDDALFYEGAYIDRPLDTILRSCAIQPFTIPALTGMPLLGALRARHNGCTYDSYGYQYLPRYESIGATELSQPCALARLRGLRKVIVIARQAATFSAKELDCAVH
jgi:hypothetical protein